MLVTAPNVEVASDLARALVDERLAACVNLIPGIRSFFRWEGQVQNEDEVLLVIKTGSDRCDALARRVQELHPYDVPEVLAFSAVGGSSAYLDWVQAESRP